MKSIIAAILCIFLFNGCAAIREARQRNTEHLLEAAGFRIVPANTPARQQSLAAMSPYSIERKIHGDEVTYVYGCPKENLAYIGSQKDYSKYRELQLQQEISDQNMSAAQLNMSAAQQWNDWPCWGPAAVLPPVRMCPRR